jgi:ferredoxin-fold anticodon binding domain-containing protein
MCLYIRRDDNGRTGHGRSNVKLDFTDEELVEIEEALDGRVWEISVDIQEGATGEWIANAIERKHKLESVINKIRYYFKEKGYPSPS